MFDKSKKIIESLSKLRKYFYLSQFNKEIPVADLLSTNESLKDFGKLWTDRQNDVLMMAALLEYEFTAKKAYSEKDLVIVKNILAEVIKFLTKCSKEWEEYEEEQRNK